MYVPFVSDTAESRWALRVRECEHVCVSSGLVSRVVGERLGVPAAWAGLCREGGGDVSMLTGSMGRARGSLGADSRWRMSHTPNRQQCSVVRRSCWEMSLPLETARHGTAQTPAATALLCRSERCAAGIQAGFFFYLNFIATSGNTPHQASVSLSQWLRMTHQKGTIYPYVGAAAGYLFTMNS